MGHPSLSTGRRWGAWACLALVATLAACSSGSKKPEPTPLAPINALLSARQAWSANVGTTGAPLMPAVAEGREARIQAIDMGRRALHDEGSQALVERLKGKVTVDRDTARRLFTLISALHWKG